MSTSLIPVPPSSVKVYEFLAKYTLNVVEPLPAMFAPAVDVSSVSTWKPV